MATGEGVTWHLVLHDNSRRVVWLWWHTNFNAIKLNKMICACKGSACLMVKQNSFIASYLWNSSLSKNKNVHRKRRVLLGNIKWLATSMKYVWTSHLYLEFSNANFSSSMYKTHQSHFFFELPFYELGIP